MDNWFSHRIIFWKQALWRPVVWVTSGLFALYWVLEFFRDEFLSSDQQEQYRLLHFIPYWQWRTWLLTLAVILLVSLLEGSYRAGNSVKSRLVKEADDLRNELTKSRGTISNLRSRLTDKAPKVLADFAIVPIIPGATIKAAGFTMTNIGDMPAVNVQIEDISNGSLKARFEMLPQILKGQPVSIVPTVEENGIPSPMFRYDLNRFFKAGRPNDLSIEINKYIFRIT
jgi:hypothetical protein